ncbi:MULTISPECIES: CRISPR-associated endonuclease Cas2 [unclassified Marichromatium]|uniref:CRISPR-associated endonuclease Cas2 n=1 Tax=unclassified Marichromatium TaxID=2618417 RepID=UPI000F3EA357|nr:MULTISPECIES: CRISPR-associated endonuclease Cas2 [unclassified Marichromatium]MBO8086608.1 CRISPR-associated endonuclease Cas2 [Marichromatium sp.]RNE89030.1 CRISPR-associated endonuclease Cas2 [Marichromatium sp. AB31]RNE92617.1 CRISPR-associated endonuclease Cas2 [Marichromatium sp. AB32]
MFMLVTYDVEAKRTRIFRKILKRYLNHEQYSVFSGDMTEAEAVRLRQELSAAMLPEDRITEITAENRKNVEVTHLIKAKSGKGAVSRKADTRHKTDYGVL